MPHLAIYTFGPPRVELDGEPVVIERSKALALLVYLALEPGEHSRQSLAVLFWPDYDQSRASAYLRRNLWALKEALGQDCIAAGRDLVRLNRESGVWVDVLEFRRLLDSCLEHGHGSARQAVCPDCLVPLQQAVELYRAGFLEGFGLRDSPGFDDWQFYQAEGLRQSLAAALERLARCQMDQRVFEPAIAAARRMVALNPIAEEGHRLLMRAYALGGQHNLALRQYQECARILEAELGVEPQPETRDLYEQIREGRLDKGKQMPVAPASAPVEPVSEAAPGAHPPAIPSPARVPPNNLPAQLTPFVGRVAELATISGLLGNPDCRLLTLLGPGGIGKTRLAIEAASRALQGSPGRYPQGVFFVPLASLSDPAYLPQTIADALQFDLRAEEAPRQQLIDYLRERTLLFVLDNFEQLVPGVDLLAEILEKAPGVEMLITSRERLNLPAEWVLDVQGLAYPEEGDPRSGDPRSLDEYSAVRLFVQEARRVRVDFVLTEEDRPGLIEICKLVQGMPLGLELAAAWTRLFSCREIAQEIRRSTDFLSVSLRGVPDRHQSLRGVFEHSWGLLSEEEKSAFRKLSIFRGPCRSAAAEYVISTREQSERDPQALFLLSALVDKSMLRRSASGYYEMHELLKQYAGEKLEQVPDEKAEAYRRYAEFYARLMTGFEHELKSGRHQLALQQMEIEIEDLRQSWRWMVEQARLDLLEQAMIALNLFSDMRSRLDEGYALFHLAADRLRELDRNTAGGDDDPDLIALLAILTYVEGASASGLGEYQHARACFHESETLLRRLEALPDFPPERKAVVSTLVHFGNISHDAKEVKRRYAESVAAFERTGNRWGQALAHLIMSYFYQYPLRDQDRARALRQESLALFDSIGNHWGITMCLVDLADMALGLGEYDEATALALRGLSLSRQNNDRWRMIGALIILGQVEVARGNFPQAHAYYDEAITLVKESGSRSSLASILDCMGYLNLLEGDYDGAEQKYRKSLLINREAGNDRAAGMALMNLADVVRERGDRERARSLYLESLSLFRATYEIWGMHWGQAIVLKKLGGLVMEDGDFEQAREHFRQALISSLEIQRPPEVLDLLSVLAEAHAQAGEPERAVELLSYVLDHPASARDTVERASRLLAHLRSELPAEQYQAAEQRFLFLDLESLAARLLASW